MLLYILITIYFCINFFFVGYYWCNNEYYSSKSTLRDKSIYLLGLILHITLGVVAVVVEFLVYSLQILTNRVDKFFLVSFYFKFYITKKVG